MRNAYPLCRRRCAGAVSQIHRLRKADALITDSSQGASTQGRKVTRPRLCGQRHSILRAGSVEHRPMPSPLCIRPLGPLQLVWGLGVDVDDLNEWLATETKWKSTPDSLGSAA